MPLKAVNRRKFIQTISRLTFYPLATVESGPMSTLFFSGRTTADPSNHERNAGPDKDPLMDLAQQIKAINDKISTELVLRTAFSVSCAQWVDKYRDLYTKPGDLSISKNNLYSFLITVCSKNFDVDIVPTSTYIKKQIDKAASPSPGQQDQLLLVPIPGSTIIEYADLPFDNLLKITTSVKFGGGGFEQNKTLKIVSAPRLENNNLSLSLFSQPVFFEPDGTPSDPIGALPVTERAKYRAQLRSQVESLLTQISPSVPTVKYPNIPLQINANNLVVVNGIRILSNSTGARTPNTLISNPFPEPEYQRHNFILNVAPAYANRILSQIVSENFKLSVPDGFHYVISVTGIHPFADRKAVFDIAVNGSISFNWVIADAKVTMNIQSPYEIQIYPGRNQIQFVANLLGYHYHIEASGFPPFGWGPKSPDDAVKETKENIVSSMNYNSQVSFVIPVSQAAILFNERGFSILSDTD
jgi:hypothetical protein